MIAPTLTGIAVGFVILAAMLWPLERFWPAIASHTRPMDRPWCLSHRCRLLVLQGTRWITRFGLIVLLLLLAPAAGVPLDKSHITIWAMPAGRQPVDFGTRGDHVPGTIWGQLAHPFWRRSQT